VVLGVHHHGKDVTRGAAGSYALTAAADFVLSVGLHPFKIGVDDEGMDIVSAFVEAKPNTAGHRSGRTQQKKKPIPESMVAFNKALDQALQQSGGDRTIPGKGTARIVQVADVRASFARHYRPRGKGGKSADGQRQAFKRALKGVLEEGSVKQDSWDGADWLWREG
jgi:hypothetical protein